jgi:hypothetical protein
MGNGEWAMVNGQWSMVNPSSYSFSATVIQYLQIVDNRFSGTARKEVLKIAHH